LYANDRGADTLADCGPGNDVLYIDPYREKGGVSDRHLRKDDCERVVKESPATLDPNQGVTRIGGSGSNSFEGTPRNDKLLGGAGDDLLLGREGEDVIWGDHIPGTTGNDSIDGGEGDDTLFGNNGNDRIRGGAGRDRIDCGPGYDVALAGSGDQILGCEDVRR
jgi:Ca2+-binding RTX toxin-like protein